MIEIERIDINELSDYDKIYKYIESDYIHRRVIYELKKRIGLKCTTILIEYPYYDKDYLSTYYSFYSKLFKNIKKECYRVHLFYKDEYGGYLTLRPTVSNTKIGKSYINPKLLLNEEAHIILGDFVANLNGEKYIVGSYPWMYQETDISVCAHVSVWSIIRYYGNKYSNYSDKRMMDIVNQTPNGLDRNIPSRGLVLTQIAEILRKNDFHPLIIQKNKADNGEFFEEVYSYIESGIPMVAAITKFGHAVAIIGHGKVNYKILDLKQDKIINSSNMIQSLIINDDNYFPYLEVKKSGQSDNQIQKYNLEDIDYVIIPLYDRMMLDYTSVKVRVYSLIESESYDFENKNVVRIYMTSSNSLKKNIKNNDDINFILKDVICKLELPRFVWCVDISSPEEYKSGTMSGKIIIDSTAGTYEEDPWLLIQDKNKIIWKNGEKYFGQQININTYPIYKNNLRGFDDE